jgi:NAD(P)H-nitrite reductase large subunit
MKDKDIVCVCNSITYGQIIEAIEKKGLKTVEEIDAYDYRVGYPEKLHI